MWRTEGVKGDQAIGEMNTMETDWHRGAVRGEIYRVGRDKTHKAGSKIVIPKVRRDTDR